MRVAELRELGETARDLGTDLAVLGEQIGGTAVDAGHASREMRVVIGRELSRAAFVPSEGGKGGQQRKTLSTKGYEGRRESPRA